MGTNEKTDKVFNFAETSVKHMKLLSNPSSSFAFCLPTFFLFPFLKTVLLICLFFCLSSQTRMSYCLSEAMAWCNIHAKEQPDYNIILTCPFQKLWKADFIFFMIDFLIFYADGFVP